MHGEAGILQDRVEAVSFAGAGNRRRNGFEVNRMKAMKPMLIMPCTASARARKAGGRLRPSTATSAPKTDRIVTQRTSEPSWFPHTPLIL
jgi:hypothetical protein